MGFESIQDVLANRYRRSRRYLLIATLVLAGVAIYLIALGRAQVWSAAHKNLLNLAMGLQSSASALLEQSLSSLTGLSAELAGGEVTQAQALQALRAAIHRDPDSAYLGFRSADRSTLVIVDHSGQDVSREVLSSIAPMLQSSSDSKISLLDLVRLQGKPDFYLPLVLQTRRSAEGPSETLFALVPLARLIRGTDALNLVPDSRITLVTDEGGRPFIYNPSASYLIPNGEAGEMLMHYLKMGESGSFEFAPPIDGKERVAGFSHSSILPFYMLVTVRASTLRLVWLRQSAAPAIILLLAMGAVVIFAIHLNAAVRDQQRHATEQEYRADHDTLTGLLNRDAFMRVLAQATEAMPQQSFVVLLLDLNRFKDINDTLGHAAGDRVLEEVGRRLGATIEPTSCVARLGGDELAVLAFGDYAGESMNAVVSSVQAALEQPITLSGVALDVSASIGAALYPHDARSPIELLRCADIAMYSAKADLRPFSRYSESLDNFTPEMLALQGELAKALREDALHIVYQPKVRLGDGALVGLEALARWTHPSIGVVPPSRFVQIAESTELIHPFTEYVLQKVTQQISDWQQRGCAIPISVNISANNLLDPGFVGKIAQILRAANVAGRLLELEVTEGALMRYIDTILKRLQEIRQLGLSLAIDDFGTGYASLAYLKRLPVQTLKIDKSFVLNLASDLADQRIVRSTIQLAHSFGMEVVAEGVESAAVAQRLRGEQCDLAQGYYFGRPLPAADIEKQWLQRSASFRSPLMLLG